MHGLSSRFEMLDGSNFNGGVKFIDSFKLSPAVTTSLREDFDIFRRAQESNRALAA